MAEISEWIRRIIYLTIFLTLLLQILPKGSYRKYVRFFAGLVFVITILNPLMKLVQQEDWEDRLVNELLYEESIREGELDFAYMEEQQKEYYARSIGSAVREVAGQSVEDLGVEIVDIEVESSNEDGSIHKVTAWVDTSSEVLTGEVRKRLAEVLSLEQSQVEVLED